MVRLNPEVELPLVVARVDGCEDPELPARDGLITETGTGHLRRGRFGVVRSSRLSSDVIEDHRFRASLLDDQLRVGPIQINLPTRQP